ncbi:hypothetical protein H8356DRAFT_1396210 [Neocallimastix lanati (nom. inval.)]|uniref:Uncharacterized protein n=1 Tax=Neocallimastix californiae TaxID=1754190 RepID=A0A1Y2C5U0_9FUNG|nr:hypothetical protein H8356DRAFT_1396210 [Neocallimastix sp. JGI-2020a]ORY42408.1 hypothetical protein LY90DRAFT_509990 [Neocallimastix californiae]|eukprot:ORY42408.1 hypothetical protein LY90DRAFT_509990 [Neocallimastix californiae]
MSRVTVLLLLLVIIVKLCFSEKLIVSEIDFFHHFQDYGLTKNALIHQFDFEPDTTTYLGQQVMIDYKNCTNNLKDLSNTLRFYDDEALNTRYLFNLLSGSNYNMKKLLLFVNAVEYECLGDFAERAKFTLKNFIEYIIHSECFDKFSCDRKWLIHSLIHNDDYLRIGPFKKNNKKV